MKPVVLTILDGWGYSRQKLGNAILNAKTPNLDVIQRNYPSLLLQASGVASGMLWGEPGNSEVGHLTAGAGRVIFQYLSRISKAIDNGEFFNNEILLKAVNHIKQNNSTLHLAGLLTSGSVHAYFNHLTALIDFAKKNNIENLKLHLFTDGKDSGLKEAPVLIKKLEDYLIKTEIGKIATVIGRNFAMDRDNNWNFTKATYDLITAGIGQETSDIYKTLDENYAGGLNDSVIPATVADSSGIIKTQDALIFFNYREDSMRQIARAFVEDNFSGFERPKIPDLFVVSFTPYLDGPDYNVAFSIPKIENGLAEVISKNGKKQLHIAETEKYAHATYFFNCLNNKPFEGETDVFIKSDKNHLEKPAMQANEIADKVAEAVKTGVYDFIILNIANADVMAHIGKLEHVIQGIEAADFALGKIKNAVLEAGGALLITADHGNAESLVFKGTGEEETEHNQNPIPFYLVAKEYERFRLDEEIAASMDKPSGFLSDVAPTILELLGLPKSSEMTGDSLLGQIKV
ncbi:MAG: phosphoglycerate mutase (2,3-diphosphoglycerate-independent) [Candidatus Yanofskybacteria bacterium RIFCSPHIGHO2_01_FULL_41_27]|uniref:2,3-bisphosphoglycerate-independent phosphoglycerate mutase n=1 Tax=Candidatus Yanofskybacteria bacterium RIFCSPHIGHO2_01_FULL_41_27 TaxID=1802662 RepID=A0A1F8EHW7_9BACT|nr:MAG: phosphoglycerate mutase (2,3-diphosphoglycerate-independent) [Candidatus Yanofskybacteria bacterium RIFCSPHIGHO2_01_FULL_41_27]